MTNPADNIDLLQRSNLDQTMGVDDQPIDPAVTPGLVGHVSTDDEGQ